MTSINLTSSEAAARSRLVDSVHYAVTLDLTVSEEFFHSRTVVSFTAQEAGSTFIDLRTPTVDAALLDGVELNVADYDAEFGLALDNLETGEHQLTVDANIPFSRTGEGLHRAVDPADNKPYFYTQFETADAKRVFACFDQPDIKATYDLTVIVKPEWKVITNEHTSVTEQAPQNGQDGQDGLDGQDAKAIHSASLSYPLSTYLIAFCVGEYTEFTDTWRGELKHHAETPSDEPTTLEVPLGLYARASIAEHLDTERLFTETKQGFDFYHRNFGVAYPFTKYDQVFVPEFNAGAMENAGCVTIRDEYVFTSKATHYRYERRADTILHELAHMWFGDLVTMKWWDDLWLNESFATWSAAISQAEETEYSTAWVTFANVEKAWAYAQDQMPTTHPVVTDASDIETVEQNFDGITYAKGASVLKQLQAYVGREEFFTGVRQHFVNHAWSNATFDDLLGALEKSSGRDLSFWADQWLKTTGINRLSPDFEVEDGKYTSFAVAQDGAEPGGGELRTHRIAVGLYSLIDGHVVSTNRVELDIDGARTEVPELVGVEQADLVLVNDDDLTYCLMQLDPASLEFVVENIDKIVDPMARTLCWSAAWEMTRAGTMKARQFVELVARGAQNETELAVLERILSQATTAQQRYADPDWAASSTLLADTMLAGTNASDADTALAFEQALAHVQLTDAAAEYFAGLLDSDDADQRWRATTALVARGDRGAALIDAQAQKDQSASGRLAAITAHAALPSAEVKREVFDKLVSGSLSNSETRHSMAGLTYVGADEYLQQFNEEYYRIAPTMWNDHYGELALSVLTGVFPTWNVSTEGIDRARTFLGGELPGGLRRLVTERLDGVERTLRLRGVDAS